MYTISRILVPVDFSPCSRAALDYGAFLGARFGAAIDVLHVWQPPRSIWEPLYPMDVAQHRLVRFESTDAGQQMKEFLAHLEGQGNLKVRGRLESGDPYETILGVAIDEAYDLIVMGTHGRTGMSHLLLGSLAEAVVRRAPCPVLTIHRADPPRRPRPRSMPSAVSDGHDRVENESR
jgi:nucleotide-binding universal stress UspA family protein